MADLQARPLVMGILNVTPDSFSDGGQHNALEDAVAHAHAMIAEGSDILDIGGESTRPGADAVGATEERNRTVPVIKAMGDVDVPISIDTYKAGVARDAVAAGAVIINDVWGLQKDPEMPETVSDTGAVVIVMHNRQADDPDVDIMDDMQRFLTRSVDLATKAGVPEDRIIVDPGIGFGKTHDQSLTCLNRLDELTTWFGLPILLGLSRKRFIGHVLDADVDQRMIGTLAANMIGLDRGAGILRVHDVAEHAAAVKMFAATKDAT